MKLYSYPGAPNPRRVRIFAAEKSIDLDVINVDLPGGEIKTPEFLAKNPSGKIPVLELDDGRTIAESVAISRYLEALVPEPNLFGADPIETAQIEMRLPQGITGVFQGMILFYLLATDVLIRYRVRFTPAARESGA